MVVPVGVEGEVSELLPGVSGDDADVAVLGEDEDVGAGVAASEADVV